MRRRASGGDRREDETPVAGSDGGRCVSGTGSWSYRSISSRRRFGDPSRVAVSEPASPRCVAPAGTSHRAALLASVLVTRTGKSPKATLARLGRRRKAFGAKELAEIEAVVGSRDFAAAATHAGVLGAAVRTGSVEAVAALLRAGVDPNAPPNPTGPPPLDNVFDDDVPNELRTTLAEQLLAAGADPLRRYPDPTRVRYDQPSWGDGPSLLDRAIERGLDVTAVLWKVDLSPEAHASAINIALEAGAPFRQRARPRAWALGTVRGSPRRTRPPGPS